MNVHCAGLLRTQAQNDPLESCESPPNPIGHARIVAYEPGGRNVEYGCIENYTHHRGDSNLRCLDGEWKGTPLQCRSRFNGSFAFGIVKIIWLIILFCYSPLTHFYTNKLSRS